MSLKNINLKVSISALLIILGSTYAYGKGRALDSVCSPLTMRGIYREANPLSDNPLLEKWVEIQPGRKDGIVEIEVNIPWGTKNEFYKLHVDCPQDPYHAIAVGVGIGQYDIGKNPYFTVSASGLLRIYTGIRVPGFSGVYEFRREIVSP